MFALRAQGSRKLAVAMLDRSTSGKPAVPKFYMTLTRRVWALALIALATMGLGTGLALYEFNNLNLDHRRAELRHEVEIAATLVRKSGASTDRPDSIRAALEQLRPLRIGEEGYFFALDMEGKALLSPVKPEIEGSSLLGVKDASGGFPFQQMLNAARTAGSGFITYIWTRPGKSAGHEKTSYVLSLPELGVMVGSGVFSMTCRTNPRRRRADHAHGRAPPCPVPGRRLVHRPYHFAAAEHNDLGAGRNGAG